MGNVSAGGLAAATAVSVATRNAKRVQQLMADLRHGFRINPTVTELITLGKKRSLHRPAHLLQPCAGDFSRGLFPVAAIKEFE
jgi:hypothetical protein